MSIGQDIYIYPNQGNFSSILSSINLEWLSFAQIFLATRNYSESITKTRKYENTTKPETQVGASIQRLSFRAFVIILFFFVCCMAKLQW